MNSITVDDADRSVLNHGSVVVLTGQEFVLFKYLLKHAGHYCRRTALVDWLWQLSDETPLGADSTIKSHICRMRKKVGPIGIVISGGKGTTRGWKLETGGPPCPSALS